MVSVTADSNVYVSALNFPGPPARLLTLAGSGHIRLDTSEEILTETMRVLRLKFDWPAQLTHHWDQKLRKLTNIVKPNITLSVIEYDPPDNRILECALEASSNYIVSADKDLLRLKTFSGAPILRVTDLLKIL